MNRNHNLPRIAYFCMEYGLHETFPIYAGGLGILAGDYLKSAADLGLPVIGIGILWRQGYTQQFIDEAGRPYDKYPELPYSDLEDTGTHVTIRIRDRNVKLAVWRTTAFGNAPLYLLEAVGDDAWITSRLYGGNIEDRIAQEIVLGIGGVRALRKLNIEVDVYHFNEGHATLAGVELIREKMAQGKSFSVAWADVRRSIVFTTHTPVIAGNESHDLGLLGLMGGYNGLTYEQMRGVGGEPFGMTVAGLRLAQVANGVAQLHGITARRMWHDVTDGAPILAITNGVHPGTWQDPQMRRAWRNGDDLWTPHQTAKEKLLKEVFQRTGVTLDKNRLLIGFARRAATYKRASLILQDAETIGPHLQSGEIQLIFAGKAHPMDEEGKNIIAELVRAAKRYSNSVVFLQNYDMQIGRLLTRGCDVWLNNPRRPLEASGTSGMKAAMNGVLNLSVLDGWWPEGCEHGVNGWQIGDGYENEKDQDDHDLGSLYNVLQNQVLPTYYNDRPRWQRMMQASIAMAKRFTSDRMLQQYYDVLYSESLEAQQAVAV